MKKVYVVMMHDPQDPFVNAASVEVCRDQQAAAVAMVEMVYAMGALYSHIEDGMSFRDMLEALEREGHYWVIEEMEVRS